MKAFHSSRQTEGMWSRDTPVSLFPLPRSALAEGSKKPPPKQTLLEPHSPAPRTPQKRQAPSRVCSGQGESATRGAAARQFPGPRCGRGLATPNDSLLSLPAPLSSHRDTDLLPAITGALQLLGYHKHRHNCSLFSLRPGGTGLPSAAFPQPFANPCRREREHQLSNCHNFLPHQYMQTSALEEILIQRRTF